MIKVVLADDHEVVRQGIRRLLEQEPELEIRGEARNGREAVLMAIALKPHVVVMDMSMPELNGLDATRQIRQAMPETEVLLYTMHDADQLVQESVKAGARGFVLKSDPAANLVAGVKALARHRPFFTVMPTEAILSGFLNVDAGEDTATATGTPLSTREREVVQLLAEGKNNRQVADVLGISVKTVETHRATIMRKLGATSVVELVRYAVRNRMIEP
jgi:DNA-binding NarL/FixJ family response regulator